MLMMLLHGFVALAVLLAANSVWAQDTAQSRAGRVALVIGNGAYAKAPIPDAVNGARSVAEVLAQGGFKVISLTNAWREDIYRGLSELSRSLEPGATGVVFYAGHALQHQGRNYVVAIDSDITGPDDLRREAIDIDLLLDPLLVARTEGSVVILDASRPNPWQELLPGGHRGLADPEPVKSVYFVCSASPGKVVSTAPSASGVFAAQLVEALKTPDLNLDAVVSRTRSAVARINGKDQRVWQSKGTPSNLVLISAAAKRESVRVADGVEAGFWDTIKSSNAAADFEAYLSAYPNGQFAPIARARLAQIQPSSQRAATSADLGGARLAARTEPPAGPVAAPAARDLSAPAPAVPAVKDCADCPELVLIPAGTMMMGSSDGMPFELPVHEVTIAKPFYMGRREVTFDEWDACVAEGGCQYRPGDNGRGRGTRPVSDVAWSDAKAYVAWLSRKTGKTYRLPSEAEWEYAARAGTRTAFYWGNAAEKDRANCSGCGTNVQNNTVATGSFPPNAFGLFDMAGNAAEWVEDCWEDNYKAAPKDGAAVVKPDCRERVLRGGAFNNDQRYARTAARFKYDFDVRYYSNGFRVVRDR